MKLFAIRTNSKDTKKWSDAVAVVIARDIKEARKISGYRGRKYIELEFFEVLKHWAAIQQYAINLIKGDLKL